MGKTCKADGCPYPIWGGGYCQRHGYLRADKKVKKSIPKIKITQVKDFSKKPTFGFEDQISMFEALWEKARNKDGRVICQFTGEDLTELEYGSVEYWVCCFAHVLPKGRFTYWKLNPENIRIVHPNFHKAVDQGTTEIRKKWTGWKFKEWDALVIEMKQKYTDFKKQNLLA